MMYKVCRHQFLQMLTEPRFYIAILLGSIPMLITTNSVIDFAKAIGEPVFILDGIICSFNDYFIMALSFVAVFLLLADVPFTQQSETYVMLRISRKKWLAGKILYMFFVCVFYYLVITALTAILVMPNAYWGNVWSDVLYRAANNNGGIVSKYKVGFSKALLKSSPIIVYMESLILSSLYAFTISTILFFLNLRFNKAVSYAIVMLLHVLGYIGVPIKIPFLGSFSLFTNSLLRASELFYNSVFIFLFISVVFIFLILLVIKRYDFKISVGTKQW